MMRHQPSKRTFTWGRALALVPLPILALLGCSTLIGLDSYTVGSGGSGGAGGTVSGGGSGGGHAGSGSSGKAGGENAGSGGTSVIGAGGEAGVSEAGAGPVNQNVGCDGTTAFVPNESIIRSCILRAGCNPNFNPVRTISECVSKNTQAALPGESCNLSSRTCADYEACEHIGIAHDDLCGAGQVTRCDANSAINCGNYDTDEFLDCKALGGTCGTYTYAVNSLVYADCKLAVTPATFCVGKSDDTAYYCQTGNSTTPDSRYYCYLGQAYGATCGKFATCYDTTDTTQTPPVPDATCYFNFNAQCTGADSAMCAGGVAKLCSGGDVINYDCGSVGLDCAVKGTDGYCVAPGCKPVTVDDCTETCGDDGVTLNFCYGGVPHAVDCTAYGFTTCTPGTKTDSAGNDVPFAACR
jgi:hypothetical protein